MSSASFQAMRCQPGSLDPFGFVRLSTLHTLPGRWDAMDPGRSATNAPSAIVAFAPHFDTHNGQNVETCFVTCVLAIGPPSGVQSPFKYRLHARMTTTA